MAIGVDHRLVLPEPSISQLRYQNGNLIGGDLHRSQSSTGYLSELGVPKWESFWVAIGVGHRLVRRW